MKEETVFAVFCLENYKIHRSLSGKQTYDLFIKHGVFDFLKEFYDILHSYGRQRMNHELDEYLHMLGFYKTV